MRCPEPGAGRGGLPPRRDWPLFRDRWRPRRARKVPRRSASFGTHIGPSGSPFAAPRGRAAGHGGSLAQSSLTHQGPGPPFSPIRGETPSPEPRRTTFRPSKIFRHSPLPGVWPLPRGFPRPPSRHLPGRRPGPVRRAALRPGGCRTSSGHPNNVLTPNPKEPVGI